MQAVRVHEFGGVDVLHVEEIPIPTPGPHQVLVRVKAAGVGPWDTWIRSGKSVLPQPLPLTPGSDLAGVVCACGDDVMGFTHGDDVYGVTNARFCGAYAQYAVVDADRIARKPRRLSYAEAASLPVIACTAQQMLFDHAQVKRGDHVLVLAGAGGVGAYAVQLAHQAGVYVVATARTAQFDYVRSLGADEVIETDQLSNEPARKYDAVMDTLGGEALTKAIAWLREGGSAISIVQQIEKEILATNKIRGGFILVDVKTSMLEYLGELMQENKLMPNVGEILHLKDVVLAHEMMEGMRPHKFGKIILSVE